jgi:hypothetical protein
MKARAEQAARLHHVRSEAHRVLARLGMVAAADIDIDALARAHYADIEHEWIDGASARVLRVGNRARICVSSAITELGARRWIACHEIGHLALDHVIEHGPSRIVERACTPVGRERSFREREASVYATELVMPAPLVARLVDGAPVTLDTAREIAHTFRTSLLASAIRLVELSGECCAVAYCTLGEVTWMVRSPSFPTWIPKRRPVDVRSIASGYFEHGTIENRAGFVPADAWFPIDRAPYGVTEITEHAAIVPSCGAVMSLLWIPRARTYETAPRIAVGA